MWNYNLGSTFKSVASRYKDRIALKFAERDYSYAELDARSDQIAHFFLRRGLVPKDVVIITSKKTFETFSVVVACWKTGVAYCFVDRFSPKERLQKIVNTCQPKLIIVDDELKLRFDERQEIGIVALDSLKTEAGTREISFSHIGSNTVAYIMFTSGSTGSPKGVAITHEQVMRFANWGEDQYSISASDTFSGLNSLFFDNSVFDLTMSFLHGASLVPLARDDFKDINGVLKYLDAKKVNTWFSVPSLLVYFLNLRAFEPTSLASMSRIIFGGEGFPKIKLKELYDLFGARVQLFNVYGPTECTCICSSYQISTRDFSGEAMTTLAPLGKLAKNFDYQIIDQSGNRVAKDSVGELVLGGPNVSPGYYNDGRQTSDKFVQNPTHEKYRDTFYKTGDLVKLNSQDQLLYFCGRRDEQIKFMGFRIELAEIEAALASIPDVKELAVTFGSKENVPEITCFLKSTVDKSLLKKSLQSTIPSYMIPRKFIYLEALPKNANGKVDKKKLASEYYD